MTIYIPNAGEEYLLRLILGNTGSCVLNIHLYAKSWTTDDCVDVTDQNGGLLQDWFVEANQLGDNSISDNGYAAQTLDGALWNFTTDFDGVTTAEYSTTINFTFTDNYVLIPFKEISEKLIICEYNIKNKQYYYATKLVLDHD